MNQPRRTLRSIRDQRRASTFVARGDELRAFRDNLNRGYDDPDRSFIYNVTGQGGVGKTTLLHHMADALTNHWAVTIKFDETSLDLPALLLRIAVEFESATELLPRFTEMCDKYQHHLRRLESDPAAPQRSLGDIGRTLGKGAVVAGRRIPFAGIALDFADEEAIGAGVQQMIEEWNEWDIFVRRNVPSLEDAQLILNPVEVLSPVLVQELSSVASRRLLALFFDTYEEIGTYVDPWLRQLLDGDFGELPAELLIVIAGRDPLDPNLWVDYQDLVTSIPLEPFSDEAARLYLDRQGVTEKRTVEVILRLSGGLPLLLATLARESPNDPSKVGDAVGTAIERFLKWIEEPERREVAIAAALPRRLDRDVLAATIGDDLAAKHFAWLVTNPFIEVKNQGWAYHPVVRPQMLRDYYRRSPNDWSVMHAQLGAYYDAKRQALGLNDDAEWHDARWRNMTEEVAYHLLCGSPSEHLGLALDGYLRSLMVGRSAARSWGEMVLSAGTDSQTPDLEAWGARLVNWLAGFGSKNVEKTTALFEQIIRQPGLSTDGRAIGHYLRGELLMDMEAPSRALDDFSQAVELQPDNVDYLLGRGLAHLDIGQVDLGTQDILDAAQLPSSNARTITRRASALLVVGALEAAVEDCNSVLRIDPQYARAGILTLRGTIYGKLEQYKEAFTDLNQAVKLRPADVVIRHNRADLYMELKRYEDALVDLDHALELEPSDVSLLIRRAELYRLINRYEKALADLDCALESDPDSVDALSKRAGIYQQLERYEEALTDFDRAMELEPTNIGALARRGLLHFKLERHEVALADFDRAVELRPNNASASLNHNHAYERVRRITQELADLALLSRGLLRLKLEQYEKALTDFTQALEARTDDPSILTHRADTYIQLKRYEAALTDLDRVLELEPEDATALSKRGRIYRQVARYEDSLIDLDHAIALLEDEGTEDASLLVSRADVLQELGDYNRALADLRRASTIEPKSAPILSNARGLLFSYLGHFPEALAANRESPGWEQDVNAQYNIAVVMMSWKGPAQAKDYIDRARSALAALDESTQLGRQHYGFGGLDALSGDAESALAHLEVAVQTESHAPAWARHDIAWVGLRGDPRFQRLVGGRQPYW